MRAASTGSSPGDEALEKNSSGGTLRARLKRTSMVAYDPMEIATWGGCPVRKTTRKPVRVPSRFVLEFDWRGLRSDEDTWSGSKVNRLIGEFLGQALPSVHFAHSDLT